MKVFFITLLGLLFIVNPSEAKIKVPVGDMEFLYKVADLPDTEEFMINAPKEDTRVVKVGGDKSTSGEYADIGILYRQYVIAYIPIWTTKDPVLVLFNENNKDIYYNVDESKMDAILKENNLNKDELLNIGFFAKIGGKLIALVLVVIMLFGFWSYIKDAKKKLTS